MHNASVLLRRGRKVMAAIGMLLIIAAIFYVSQRGADLKALITMFGYPGVVVFMFLTSSTIVLPAPGFGAVLLAGTWLNPILVGLAAALGAAFGELTGYLLGVGGTAVLDVRHGKNWARIHYWLEKRGALAIIFLAATPNPFFDVLGMVAGSVGYPIKPFWLYCFIGKAIKYIALAYMSNSAMSWWNFGN